MIRTLILSTSLLAASTTALRVPAASPAVVEVIGSDYAFKIPTELSAGRTVFRFRNTGKVWHELNIALLKPGATVQQFMSAVNASRPVDALVDTPVGVLFAEPGKRSPSTLSTDLVAGRTYVVRCVLRDTATAPRHEKLGMFSMIRVRTGATPITKALPVDTIVGTDYAYRYSRTLAPGVHRFAFANAGKQRHELTFNLLKKGATLAQVMKVAATPDGDVDQFFETSFGLLHSPGGTNPSGVIEFELVPGREYLIGCNFSDTDKSPPHSALGMTGIIRVAPR